MKVTQWDRVLSSSPINKQAAVGGTTGRDIELPRNKAALEWDGPPQYRRPNRIEMSNPSFVDLTGTRKGRLLVLGMMAERGNDKATWVCRCSCGKYVARKSRSLKNPMNTMDCCVECQHVQQLKRNDSAEERVRRKLIGL